jgi:hypothetical protein
MSAPGHSRRHRQAPPWQISAPPHDGKSPKVVKLNQTKSEPLIKFTALVNKAFRGGLT